MNTLQLSNGLTILAKDSDPTQPLKYGNRTMAEKKAYQLMESGKGSTWCVPHAYQVAPPSAVTYGSEWNDTPLPAGFYVVVGIVERTEEEQDDADYRAVLRLQELEDLRTDDADACLVRGLGLDAESAVLETISTFKHLGGVVQAAGQGFQEFQKSFRHRPPFATVSGHRINPRNRHNHVHS